MNKKDLPDAIETINYAQRYGLDTTKSIPTGTKFNKQLVAVVKEFARARSMPLNALTKKWKFNEVFFYQIVHQKTLRASSFVKIAKEMLLNPITLLRQLVGKASGEGMAATAAVAIKHKNKAAKKKQAAKTAALKRAKAAMMATSKAKEAAVVLTKSELTAGTEVGTIVVELGVVVKSVTSTSNKVLGELLA